MNFAKLLRTPFLQDSFGRLLLIFSKLDIQTFNSKSSPDQYCWHTTIIDE